LPKSVYSTLLSTSGIARLALASLLALSGGTARLRVKLGMKVYLDKTPISSIQANLSNGQGIAPGQKLPLVVQLTPSDGKVLVTEGKGQGKVMWKDLEVSASVVLGVSCVLACFRSADNNKGIDTSYSHSSVPLCTRHHMSSVPS